MQRCTCSRCQDSVPINDSVTILGEQLCLSCAEHAFEVNSQLKKEDVRRNLDPTICATCGLDGGGSEMEQIAGLPICSGCRPLIMNRPFPVWIKVSALVLVLLVVFSFVTNWRFVQANSDMGKIDSAMTEGDARGVADLFASAATHVPEVADLDLLASYWTGVALLIEDNPEGAIVHFNDCLGGLPPEYKVADYILSAKLSAAFIQQDYNEFLRLARLQAVAAPDDLTAQLSVASALACLYADTGDEAYADQTRAVIDGTPTVGRNEVTDDYIMRIRHRLDTRMVISPEEFAAQYPDGWAGNGEDQ